jgi:hypothetical protein
MLKVNMYLKFTGLLCIRIYKVNILKHEASGCVLVHLAQPVLYCLVFISKHKMQHCNLLVLVLSHCLKQIVHLFQTKKRIHQLAL